MKKCPSCQKENPEDSQFCSSCGASLTAHQVPAASRATPTAKKKRGPLFYVAVSIVGIFVALIALSVLLSIFSRMEETSDRPTSRTETPTKKIYSRSELTNLVENRTDTEVIRLLGRPESTIDYGGSAGTSLIYHGITKDPYTDKIDRMALIQVKRGVVAYVTFN